MPPPHAHTKSNLFTSDLDIRNFQTTLWGVADYINFQTKKFQIRLGGGGVEKIW